MNTPVPYMQTFYEPREGFKFEQPVQRINGMSYYQYPENSFERQNWGFIYYESKKYNDTLEYSRFNSELWKNNEIKKEAFNKIYEFVKNGRSKSGSSITPLFNFEIFLMNDGFKMSSFSELNAINPAITILCEKVNGDELINVLGFKKTRTYIKGKKEISLCFGLECFGVKTNFYFEISNSNDAFQVDNDFKNYKKAVKGLLPSLTKKTLSNKE